MDMNMNKIFGSFLSSFIGAYIGWLIGDVIDYKKHFEINIIVETENNEDNLTTFEVKPKKIDYTGFNDKTVSIEDLASKYKTSVADESEIYIVSYAEWDSQPDYEKESYSYYSDDGVFTDANEDLIENPQEIFGANIHLHFGEESDDPDIVYIRNSSLSKDYEIVKIHNSYSVVVLGEPPKVTRAKKRKKVVKNEDADDYENTK